MLVLCHQVQRYTLNVQRNKEGDRRIGPLSYQANKKKRYKLNVSATSL
jgi:hypothetical protein